MTSRRLVLVGSILPFVALALVACLRNPTIDGPDYDAMTDYRQEDGAWPPAPDFALPDLNPLSPTYEEERRLSDQEGKVMVIYFSNVA